VTPSDLPLLDEHERAVGASPDRTWAALDAYVGRLTGSSHPVLSRVLGTVPRSGFEVVDSTLPHEVILAGRHRFATYRLVFRVDPAGEAGSRLCARSYAVFQGVRGWAYRTALLVSTGHVRATQHMLRTVARRAETA